MRGDARGHRTSNFLTGTRDSTFTSMEARQSLFAQGAMVGLAGQRFLIALGRQVLKRAARADRMAAAKAAPSANVFLCCVDVRQVDRQIVLEQNERDATD